MFFSQQTRRQKVLQVLPEFSLYVPIFVSQFKVDSSVQFSKSVAELLSFRQSPACKDVSTEAEDICEDETG
jgi:hypothetical protein